MSNLSLLTALGAVAISLSMTTLAQASDNSSRARAAKVTVTAKHSSHKALRQSYARMRTDEDTATLPSSSNAIETARPPAQPGQW